MPTRAGAPARSSALGRERVAVVAFAASDPAAPVMDDGMGGGLPARRGARGRAAGEALAGLLRRGPGPVAPQAGAESIVLPGERLRIGVIGRPAGGRGGMERLWPVPFGQGR